MDSFLLAVASWISGRKNIDKRAACNGQDEEECGVRLRACLSSVYRATSDISNTKLCSVLVQLSLQILKCLTGAFLIHVNEAKSPAFNHLKVMLSGKFQ